MLIFNYTDCTRGRMYVFSQNRCTSQLCWWTCISIRCWCCQRFRGCQLLMYLQMYGLRSGAAALRTSNPRTALSAGKMTLHPCPGWAVGPGNLEKSRTHYPQGLNSPLSSFSGWWVCFLSTEVQIWMLELVLLKTWGFLEVFKYGKFTLGFIFT